MQPARSLRQNLPSLDMGIATTLALLAVVAAALDGRGLPGWIVLIVSSLLMTAPLAWRRVHPVAVVLVGAGALAAAAAVTEAPESAPTLLGLLIAVYSVAAYGALRPALAAAFVAACAVGVAIATDPSDSVANVPPTLLLFIGAPFVAGLVARSRERANAELRARADALEAEREQTAREAAAQERARIARELHDVVSHGMSMIAVQADAAEAALETRPELARTPVAAVKRAARDSLTDMRRMLGLLRDNERAAAEEAHGVADIPALVERVRAAGLAVELVVEGVPRPLSPEAELTAYRIVQEALTNAVKHAKPSRADVAIVYGDSGLTVTVTDDGAPPAVTAEGGHGLIGMKERVELLGGQLVAEPAQGGGFRVNATLHDLPAAT